MSQPAPSRAPELGVSRRRCELLVERAEAHWSTIRAAARGEAVRRSQHESAAAFAAHIAQYRDAISLALVSHTWGLAGVIGCEPGENARGRGELLHAAYWALQGEDEAGLQSYIEDGTASVVLVDKGADPALNITALVVQAHQVLAENATHRLLVMPGPVALRLRELRGGLVDGISENANLSTWDGASSALTLALASEHMAEVYRPDHSYRGDRLSLDALRELAQQALLEA